jgi:hypothetical protein
MAKKFTLLWLAATFIIILGSTCESVVARGQRETWPKAKKATADTALSLSHETSCIPLQKLFSIDLQDLNGYYAKVYVYISNKDSIRAINRCILAQYENRYKEVISIWYLDRPNFARQYGRAIDDNSISDAKFKEMDKHLIATYEQFAGKEGSWEFNQ